MNGGEIGLREHRLRVRHEAGHERVDAFCDIGGERFRLVGLEELEGLAAGFLTGSSPPSSCQRT